MLTAQTLKIETEDLLKKRGYPVNSQLPQVEELTDLQITPSRDVRRRCLVLMAVCARAYGATYDAVASWIEANGLRNSCTTAETELIGTKKLGDEAKVPFRHQPEALWEFAWILKMIPTVDHFKSCSDKLVHMFPKPGEDPAPFLSVESIQEPEALWRESDQLFRIHWAVRDATLRSRKPPNGLGEYVTRYRLQAINWSVNSGTAWDEVDTST